MTAAPEPTQPEPDGSLPLALRLLDDAVSALIDARGELAGRADCPDCRQENCPGHMNWVDSWYQQLADSTAGETGGGHTGAPRSLPPAWTDAVQTLMEIDTAVWSWQNDPGPFDGDLSHDHPPTPETVRRLRLILKRGWRPQDVSRIEAIIKTLGEWLTDIKTLFSIDPVRALWAAEGGGFAACPACDKTMAKKRDRAGEMVGTPALQLMNDGSTRCQSCRTSWGPDQAMWVCRMLGYPLPSGVLE